MRLRLTLSLSQQQPVATDTHMQAQWNNKKYHLPQNKTLKLTFGTQSSEVIKDYEKKFINALLSRTEKKRTHSKAISVMLYS